MYQLDSLPRPGPNLPSFRAMCTLALPTVTAWGWAGLALPPSSTALSEQFTWLSPPPQSPENKLPPPQSPGSWHDQAPECEEEPGGRKAEIWAQRRLEACEDPRPPESLSVLRSQASPLQVPER